MTLWTPEWLAQHNARMQALRVPRTGAGNRCPHDPDPGVRERDPMLVMGEPPAVEEQNATGSDRRAAVALRTPGAAGESGLQRPTNKFHAIRTEGLGPNGERRVYDSRKEARVARELNAEMSAGLIVSWVPQVSLPMGKDENGRDVRYRADALAVLKVNPDGTFVGRFVDVKGKDTPASRAKRASLRRQYQIDVKVIT